MGITGIVRDKFKSNLEDRNQFAKIGGVIPSYAYSFTNLLE